MALPLADAERLQVDVAASLYLARLKASVRSTGSNQSDRHHCPFKADSLPMG